MSDMRKEFEHLMADVERQHREQIDHFRIFFESLLVKMDTLTKGQSPSPSTLIKAKVMSEKEFCEHVGISRVTANRLRGEGKLPHYKIGTKILYGEQHVEQFLRAHERSKRK